MTYQRNRPDVTVSIEVGDVFGRWTIINAERIYQRSGSRNRPYLHCRCICGNEKLVAVVSLRHKQGSCGCGQREAVSAANTKDGSWKAAQVKRRTKDSITPDSPMLVRRVRNGKQQEYWVQGFHGQSKTKLYQVWKQMRARCSDPKSDSYPWYGGRGIKVCDEWEHNFQLFWDWAKAHGYAQGLEIDRVDPDGDYEPSNCRWVTKAVNLQTVSRTGIKVRFRPVLSRRIQKEAQRRGIDPPALVKQILEDNLP